jgi:membrane associated rhomboid family serine protease
MLIPYAVDVPMYRWPITNWGILAAMLLAFGLELSCSISELWPWILTGWTLQGLIGHMWLHKGILHLAGNMIFLWTFGNAVCAKVGNVAYPLLYVALGLFAGAVHLVADGTPVVGASGAINGVIGMYLVLYPLNDVSCAYVFLVRNGVFRLSGYWLILAWVIFDIWGAFASGSSTAYFAHIGGFAAGFAVAAAAVRLGRVTMEPGEKSLLQVLGMRLDQARPHQTVSAVAPPANTPTPSESRDPKTGNRDAPPLFLKCTCGKALLVPARFIGKMIQCPACSGPVLVKDKSVRHG